MIPGFNQPPYIDPIPDQTTSVGEEFAPLDLRPFVHDPDFDFLNWRYDGVANLQITFDHNHIAHILTPDNWEGEEDIALIVSDEWGQEASITVRFKTIQLKAQFSADTTEVMTSHDVHFTDESEDNPTSWEWDFDTDGVIDSAEQNPTWQYTNPGIYTVTLRVLKDGNSDEEVKTDYITVVIPPEGIDLVGAWNVAGAYVNWRGRQRIRGDFSISNIGPTPLDDKVQIEYFLSSDSTLSADDTLVSSRRMRIDERKRIHININDNGGEYILFYVDSKNKIDELNEDNNVVS
jgi:hypothetical protein